MSGRKAYAVLEEVENTGGIVFAKHAIVARREGANQFAGGEFDYVSCRRAAWADEFAENGDVPISVMVAHGWHFECGSCGSRIDEDMLWERDLRPTDIVGSQHSAAYCNAVCEARYNLRRAEAVYRERRWIRRFEKIIKRRFPGVTIGNKDWGKPHAHASNSKGKWTIQQVWVSFDFPGSQYGPASLRYNRDYPDKVGRPAKPHWSCAGGDREAFEAFAASCKQGPHLPAWRGR